MWNVLVPFGLGDGIFVPGLFHRTSMNNSEEQHVLHSIQKLANWLTVEEATQRVLGYCVDGRTTHPIFGMLGGTGGALLRMIQAFVQSLPDGQDEALVKIVENLDQVLELCRSQIKVCTHTDDHAMTKNEPTGCGYLKMYRDFSGDYGFPGAKLIVPKLVKARAKDDEFEVLMGKHQEIGTLVINSNSDGGKIPMIQPSVNGKQYFVYHPQIERALYKLMEMPLLTKLEEITQAKIHPAEFREKLAAITQKHVAITLEKLAPGKLVYEVGITSPTKLTIKETIAA